MNKRSFLAFLGLTPVAAFANQPPKGWMPIETAPKDKTILLYAYEGDLAEHNQKIGIGKYAVSWKDEYDNRTRHLFELFQYEEQDGTKTARVLDAIYWMPLPEPPKGP